MMTAATKSISNCPQNDHIINTLFQAEAALESLDRSGITVLQVTVCGTRSVIQVANGPELKQLKGQFSMIKYRDQAGNWVSEYSHPHEGALITWSVRGH